MDFRLILVLSLLTIVHSQFPEDIWDYGKDYYTSIFTCNKIITNVKDQSLKINLQGGITYPEIPNRALFILDLKCDESIGILQEANRMNLFSHPIKWLLFHQSASITEIAASDWLTSLNILIDSDVTLHTANSKPVKVFKRSQNEPMEIEQSPHKRHNVMANVIRASIVLTNDKSLGHLTDKRDKHIDSIAKVNYVLMTHLAGFLNATFNYSREKTWGYFDKNTSSWSGMIGELTTGGADIGGTPLFVTADRIQLIDYIAMTTPTKSKFIFRQPKLSYVTNVYTLPFDTLVWVSISFLLFIIATILYFVVKWERTYVEHEQSGKDESFSEVALVTFGAMCQQGTATTPKSYPGRIAMLFLFVSLMFLYTSYSANIVALLQSSSNSIQSLKDILNSRLEVGVDDTVFNHFYFPNATEPIRRALYLQKVAPPNQPPKYYKIDEGITKMRQGLFAFHVETGPGYKFIIETFREDEKCGLQEIQFLQVDDPYIAIRKNSSYKEMLKVGLRLLQSSGIQNREFGLIYTKKPQCLTRGTSFISVGLVDCYPAAVVLAGGFSAAFLILTIEIYLGKRQGSHARNNTRHST